MLSLRLIKKGMALHKLFIDEFDEIDYSLIAIHTSLEEYRLAFLINQKLSVLLTRSHDNIQITAKNGSAQLSRFVYEDVDSNVCWNLLQNKSDVYQSAAIQQDLFFGHQQRISGKAYLMPEFKKVDYFLQLQNTTEDPDLLTPLIQALPKVTMSYTIDTTSIKSRNNLIF